MFLLLVVLKIIASSTNAKFWKVFTVVKVGKDGMYLDYRVIANCLAEVALLTAVETHIFIQCETARVIRVTAHKPHKCRSLGRQMMQGTEATFGPWILGKKGLVNAHLVLVNVDLSRLVDKHGMVKAWLIAYS